MVCPRNNCSELLSFPLNISAKLARKRYEHMRREAASIRIQKLVRADRARKNHTSLQASAIIIQSGMRALAAQNEYIRLTKASIEIQVKQL